MTTQCPSAAWDDHCQQNDFPDDICFECHVHIGESPKGDSLIEGIVLDDGFCSIKCREAELLKMRGRMLLLTHIDGVLSYAQGLRPRCVCRVTTAPYAANGLPTNCRCLNQ